MMEKEKYIENLVERFLDGETTQAEEQELYGFFSGSDIPEHLLPYKDMFAWFDSGIKEEVQQEEKPVVPAPRPKHRFRIWGTVAAVAATIALLIVIRPGTPGDEFDPFEGSYIVRNGQKITDPETIRPELESTLKRLGEQGDEFSRMLFQSQEQEIRYVYDKIEHGREMMDFINSFPEGEARNEVMNILFNE